MYLSIKKTTTFIFAIILGSTLLAQIPVGAWREHLPYSLGKVIALSNDRVYCSTQMALFYYDKTDASITKLSKINALSDLEPGYIAYSSNQKKLIIGYNSGNIDIIENDRTYNFPDIKVKNIIADKTINHINIKDDMAYISTGFGIVAFNLKKNEFTDTYIIGPGGSYSKINSTVVHENYIYALTNSGIFKGDLSDPFLGNFQNWEKITNILNANGIYTQSVIFNNQLLFLNKINLDSCHVIAYQNDHWDTIFTNLERITALSVNTDINQLLITHAKKAEVYNTNYESILQYNIGYCNHGMIGKDNNIWLAPYDGGILHYKDDKFQKLIKPSGPGSKNAFKVYYNNGVMQIAPGGYTQTGAGIGYAADVFNFSDERWTKISENHENDSVLRKLNGVIDFASQSSSNKYMVATYYYGLFEVENNKVINVYNRETTNGILSDSIGGLTYDKYGNLYVISNFTNTPFSVKTPDNKWYSYEYDPSWMDFFINATSKLINTRNNDKWAISSRGKGFFVYNDKRTPADGTDDVYKMFILKQDANTVMNSHLNDIVQDVEGAIWIATGNGIAVFDYPEDALSNSSGFYARAPQIVVDGFLKGLLEGENVTSIAVDGANRKWLGTEGGGLFLVSPDGTEQIIAFNVDNSKLISNNIYSLSINQKTGELFIGTDKGLQSYKSTSTENKISYSDIYAFPNPVKGNYNGLITIRGLMFETNVKITDISGRKVYETISNGGDAIWNGKDLSGNKVASGIYLVMCTLPDGRESEVTKILIVN